MHGHAEGLSEQGCVVFSEDKGCTSVKQNSNNIMNNNKNMNRMANFSFLTIVHTSFFSLDTY